MLFECEGYSDGELQGRTGERVTEVQQPVAS